jgi:hypothetical protein
MPEIPNFLLGYGERLVEEIGAIPSGAPKAHPYSFEQAQERLSPRVKAAAGAIADLPAEVCPRDETVALLALHPTYIAKSYFPRDILRAVGVEAVGSRARDLTPERVIGRQKRKQTSTTELFVAGPRSKFQDFAREIDGWSADTAGADDLIKIEDFRAFPAQERVKPIRTKQAEPLLEVILHARPGPNYDYIIEGFESYLQSLDIALDLDRRIYAGGLCFLPLRVPRPMIGEVARFSFLRLAREMPRLRQFRPVIRAVTSLRPFAPNLPDADPIDPTLRVAVFDGGIPKRLGLERWVRRLRSPGV